MSEYVNLERYIQQKLNDLEKQKDMQEMIWKGRLSFGVNESDYAHLPAWNDLVLKKKRLVRWVWIDAFLLSLIVVSIISDVWEKFDQNWWKAVIYWVLTAAVVMLFWTIGSYYSLFAHFRQTEREVRKLIYQDILDKMEKERR